MTDEPNETDGHLKKGVIALIVGGVIGLWLLTPFGVRYFVTGGYQEYGQAGDLYGTINALFSGLAFAGVIVAILLQREELSLQRQELKMTRTELARSAAAQDESQKALNKTIYAQSFKVAMDIIEAPEAIQARRIVWENLKEKRSQPENWGEGETTCADKVARTFETVGTMIRRGILPSEYIVETWSVPIVRNWWIIELQLKNLRQTRKDPFIAQDFEWLAGEAASYLRSKGIERKELGDIKHM